VTPELQQLLDTLEVLRAGVLKKLAGLGDDDARRSTVPSGTNIAGLVQHLTFVESSWFERGLAGAKAVRGRRSMQVDPGLSLRDLRAGYRAACDASNEVVTAQGDNAAVRRALLAVIQETARHAGHADIIREQIDGQTGR
jgi:CTP:molybdopterin cytidylyltransferase MocA